MRVGHFGLEAMFSKLCNIYARICFGACQLALTGMLLLVVVEVFRRYILNNPTQSSLEITEYLLVSISILPLAVILQHDRHVSVDTLTTRLSLRAQAVLKLICRLITAAFALVVFYFGADMAIDALMKDARSSSLLAFPLGIAYGVIPIGFLSLALTSIDEAISCFRNIGELAGDKP
jgi:TRAP-type C4-dicarboxylate transport system permease small subunit